MGLRFSITRAHSMTPYRVLYGREPMLPSSILIRNFDLDKALATVDEGMAEEYTIELAGHMEEIRQVVVQRLALYDLRSKKYVD